MLLSGSGKRKPFVSCVQFFIIPILPFLCSSSSLLVVKNISSESDKGHRTLLYLEAGTILVNSRHLAKRVDVSGTKTNNENAKLQVFIRPVVRRQQEIESKKSRIKQDSASLAAYQRK